MKEYIVKIYDNGDQFWYLNYQLHREDGPAIEYANGSKFWYLNGNLHREDGPAIESSDGNKFWYLNNKLHREDGPAIECDNGNKYWYLNGKQCYTESEYNEEMSKRKEDATICIKVTPVIEINGKKYILKEI